MFGRAFTSCRFQIVEESWLCFAHSYLWQLSEAYGLLLKQSNCQMANRICITMAIKPSECSESSKSPPALALALAEALVAIANTKKQGNLLCFDFFQKRPQEMIFH
jgi:hypothetical protein